MHSNSLTANESTLASISESLEHMEMDEIWSCEERFGWSVRLCQVKQSSSLLPVQCEQTL